MLMVNKIPVFDLNGATSSEVELPPQFSEEVREDLMRRAHHAYASLFYQPKGSDPRAGLKTSAEYYGRRHAWRQTINTGRSRLPREKLAGGRLGRVLRVPHAVKGRRAHPPKPQKQIIERINKKENNKAMRSAIAATASKEFVLGRGHLYEQQLPLIVDAAFENIAKARDVEKTFISLKLEKDLAKAARGRKAPSGIRRLRGRGVRQPRSVLVVVSKQCPALKAAANLAGVDVATVDNLNAKLLVPGGHAGRLTLWTLPAVQKLAEEKLYY